MKINWKTIISVVLLLWSIMGLFAFYSQSTMSPEAMAQLEPAQRDIWAMTPTWVIVVYAIAVGAGFVGAIGLLMRKAWAMWAYAISLFAVIVQFGFTFLATPILTTMSFAEAVPFPVVIFTFGAIALWLARKWKRQAYLN